MSLQLSRAKKQHADSAKRRYGLELLEWRQQKRAQASRSAAAMASFASGTRAAAPAAAAERAGEPARQAKRGSASVSTTAAGGKPAGQKTMKGGYSLPFSNLRRGRSRKSLHHSPSPCMRVCAVVLCYVINPSARAVLRCRSTRPHRPAAPALSLVTRSRRCRPSRWRAARLSFVITTPRTS